MIAKKITHHNEDRILVEFPYDKEKTDKIRKIKLAKWTRTFKGWHLPYTKDQ